MEYLDKISKNFDAIIEGLREELMAIRTNRPSPKMIEDIKVNYLGQILLIKQLGSIAIDPPRDLVVSVWDQGAIAPIIAAIEAASLGIGTSNQGRQIRITLPQLTEDRKQELIKLTKSTSENSRIKMRLGRDEAVKIINDLKDEDDRFRAKEKLQKLVDSFNAKVDELVDRKTQDILE